MRRTKLLGIILISFGVAAFFSNFSLTGAVIGVSSVNNFLSFISVMFLIAGFLILMKSIQNKVVGSVVKQDPLLLSVAKEIKRKESVKKDINHLLEELNKGNANPGLGTHAILPGVYELRGRNGGRVYYEKTKKDKYEILGYSDKSSQNKVIDKLRKLYAS